MVLLFPTSKKYDKVIYTPYNWLSPSLNNCHLHEISLFFVLPTYFEIILIRWLHDPIVTKFCQAHRTDYNLKHMVPMVWTILDSDVMAHISGATRKWHVQHWFSRSRSNITSFKCKITFSKGGTADLQRKYLAPWTTWEDALERISESRFSVFTNKESSFDICFSTILTPFKHLKSESR